MSRRLIVIAFAVSGLAWLAPGAAYAQYRATARIDRAADNAASARLGRVGGLNTGRYGDPTRLTNIAPSGVGDVGRGLSQPNFFGGGWSMARLPVPALPQAFMSGQLGANVPITVSPWAHALRGAQAYDLARASGLQTSFELGVPLVGIGPTEIRFSDGPYFVPEATGTAFHSFFGLKPTKPKPASDVPTPDHGWVELLERENDDHLRDKTSEALERFKAATEKEVGQPFERLSEAQVALRMVRDLDREAYVPSLLLVHIALEKRQLSGAIVYLADAVKRHPAVFVERHDVASYFGDPEVLERTARAYLKIGDTSRTPEAYTLQAYCAWVLDDQARLREALDRMISGELAMLESHDAAAVRNALTAATR